MRFLASFILAGVSLTICAGELSTPKDSFLALQAHIQNPECRLRLEKMGEFRLLFAVAEFREFLKSRHATDALRAKLSSWSYDLLIKIILQLEQEYLISCGETAQIEEISMELKNVYLSKLGIEAAKRNGKEVSTLFRAFITLAEERESIAHKIASKKWGRLGAKDLIGRVYGSEKEIAGVVGVAASSNLLAAFESSLKEICPSHPCLFWDSRMLYKWILTPQKGVGAFVPELGLLVLSEDLVMQPSILHKMVLLHELSHAIADKHWPLEFQAFSGWKKSSDGKWNAQVTPVKAIRKDVLTEASLQSPFSVLPDAVYVGSKQWDGFVLGKSYDEARKRGDPSEDFADHVAVFWFLPERFCFQGKEIAPQKFRWLTAHLHRTPKITCLP